MKYTFQEVPLKEIQRKLDLEKIKATAPMTIFDLRKSMLAVMAQADDRPSLTSRLESKRKVWDRIWRYLHTSPNEAGLPADKDQANRYWVETFNKEFTL